MKVKDMLDIVRMDVYIEFRDENNYVICRTLSKSSGVLPYLNRTVTQWFPVNKHSLFSLDGVDVVISIAEEEKDG